MAERAFGVDMRPGDDTYVPGYLMAKATEAVGAIRAAAFVVRSVEVGQYALELFRYLPAEETDDFASRQMADALRRYVIPSLADGKDRVVPVPRSEGMLGDHFVLVFVGRDSFDICGVTAMEIECTSRREAGRRMARLKEIMH